MQRVQLRSGDAVRIRGERWRVAGESLHGAASIVEVHGCDAGNRGITARFILPFEPIDPLTPRITTPRIVSMPRWRRAARAALAAAVPRWTSLRAAARARLTIIPFQLEPALAVVRGDGCRLLIADEVGLGKTIQAGLIVAETIARTPDARILVVSPAGLRDQWHDELRSRFALHPEVLDAGGLARSGAHVAPGVNPWAIHPIVITSIDFVKRPDVMRSLEALLWDVVVFDEAHTLAGRSDRAAAAAGLAERARCVVLLTATPHSGDDDAFTRLGRIGDLGAGFPLITFRRTRADVRLPHGRRSILLRIRPTAAESVMHDALSDYARLVRQQTEGTVFAPAASLVAAILMRRACSSATSLARSLERRITLLAGCSSPQRDQLTLPFMTADDDAEPGAELAVPALRSAEEERRWLERLLTLAREASLRESKIGALRRFLARANEPALVFTEYRDTLQHLAASLGDRDPLQLHGGLITSERRDTLRTFNGNDGRLLLATDAASEGLNLHHRCRLVVNLELPWTPVRLEQRIGRVDRLGQRRRVHAVQLIAGTCEDEAIRTFAVRSERVRSALDSTSATHGTQPPRAQADAAAEAARLQLIQSISRDQLDGPIVSRPVMTIVRREGLPRGTTWAVRLPCLNNAGHLVFETIVGLHDTRTLRTLDQALEHAAARGHEQVLATLTAAIRPSLLLLTHREEAIADALRVHQARLSAGLLQPGLFDRRAERAAASQSAIVAEAVEKSMSRLAMLGALRSLREDSRTIAFAIVYC